MPASSGRLSAIMSTGHEAELHSQARASCRKLLGNLFDLEDLGGHDLKGISGPAWAAAALRPSSVEGRFDALHAGRLTELVGREEELELLLRRWSRAKTGEGRRWCYSRVNLGSASLD
jgi:hypothetical protein